MDDELSRLVDALPGLIWTARGDDTHIDFVNQRWCDYTGLTYAEACGQGWRAAVHPDDVTRVFEWWPETAVAGVSAELELRLRRFDGQYRWFLARISPLTDAAGQVVKWCGINSDIDQRKRAEEEVRALRSNLRQLCESIPGLVCTMTASGEVDGLNKQLLEYFGRTAEEMRNWASSDAVHPDDRLRVTEALAVAVRTGSPYDVEHRCRRADGVYRWFHVRALPARDAEGAITGWFVLLTDVEDRKQAEESTRASERNLKVIISTIPALVWSARPDGVPYFFNQHYLDYLGLSTEQARGTGWTAAVHPEDLTDLLAGWANILASEEQGEAEARLRRFDGEYRWFLVRANPLRDEAGRIVSWYCINTDIDDRRRTEDELRRSEAFLAEGERLNLTGSFCWNADTNAFSYSEQYSRILGFDCDEPVTLDKVASRIHPEDLPMVSEKMALAGHVAGDHDYELRLRMPDGSLKYLRTVSYGTRARDGQLEHMGAIQDVTERRLSEQALGRVRSELAYMTRVASLGALTASIAHEVNQPLAGIITNASTCLRMLALEPPNVYGARETARRTIRDGNRASDVITRLRALFANRAVAAEAVDLNEAAREVMALSASELQRARVVLRTELEESLPLLIGDRVQLQQVILNLLLNASAAMSSVSDRPRRLAVRTERDGPGHVRLTVRDTGVGLDPLTVARLFEPFYSTKPGGMGLGLSVSRSIVESHRGRIWAEPADSGPGAAFSFSVPYAPAEPASIARKS